MIFQDPWDRAITAEQKCIALEAKNKELTQQLRSLGIEYDDLADKLCSAESRLDSARSDHRLALQISENLIKEYKELLGRLHPWYGPCDGYGIDQSCSECARLVAEAEPGNATVKRLREERETMRLQLEGVRAAVDLLRNLLEPAPSMQPPDRTTTDTQVAPERNTGRPMHSLEPTEERRTRVRAIIKRMMEKRTGGGSANISASERDVVTERIDREAAEAWASVDVLARQMDVAVAESKDEKKRR